MDQPDLANLLEKTGSKYLLVVLASKRARQITEAGVTFSDDKSVKPVTVALYEIEEGIISI